MTAEEKAKELVGKYLELDNLSTSECVKNTVGVWVDVNELCLSTAKQCALIAVDEIVENQYDYITLQIAKYWQEVRREINNL